jgi:chromosome partitioning protein
LTRLKRRRPSGSSSNRKKRSTNESHAILFTRTSSAIRPRTLQHIQDEFRDHGVQAFRTHINEREAYRALFSFGGTLELFNPQHVSNVTAAIVNARAFAGEVVSMLRAATAAVVPAEAVA